MSAGIGNTYASANLQQDLGSGAPATWYAQLLVSLPTAGDGTGLVQASYTGLARIPITNNSGNFPPPSVVSGVETVVVGTSVTFAIVAGLTSPITVAGIALFDAPTGGNFGRVAAFGSWAAPVTYSLANGAQLSIAAGNLVFKE